MPERALYTAGHRHDRQTVLEQLSGTARAVSTACLLINSHVFIAVETKKGAHYRLKIYLCEVSLPLSYIWGLRCIPTF